MFTVEYVQMFQLLTKCRANSATIKDTIGLSMQQRNMLSLALNEKIDVASFVADNDNYLEMVKVL